ncbi:AAA family ATPase [Pseudomonas syringae]|uniref:AAA family ATPase n=1 Tax=Pseudomonas syringae TaxID=317 RepID=UPI0018E5BDF6|nr:AAA family ATPase [Pseudomonas syringae]MBI6750754.1 AAA family ATPase [Pseudomonas syringae]MBI6770537.1 AAA family ATPase [Pseudomonas syringae]MBI6774089.1 AAA family ATPase [Pseudomonas syringae]MBI6790881.1 AAA family ATPase [Pseudomonas syringae]MBI6803718.1 AAA family ATPase [Pseudomonas syringae]
MSNLSSVIQVSSVKPGSFGGAVFSGRIIGQNKIYTCRASYKIITRIPQPGECWQFKGSITGHDQFRDFVLIESCHIVNLPIAAYVERLLIKHPAFRGLSFGKAKVSKLVRAFGAENLAQALTAGRVSLLAEVISPDLARKVVDAWRTLQNEISTIEFLMEHDFDPGLAQSILKVCQTDTVERLKLNPYSLVAFQGIHPNLWKIVDAAAAKLGIPYDDPRRLAGLVENLLYVRLDQGHTAYEIEELKAALIQKLPSASLVDNAIDCALQRRAVCVKKSHGTTLIQPLGAALTESKLEQRVADLLSAQASPFHGSLQELEQAIEDYCEHSESASGYSLTRDQKSAVMMALTNRISALTGFGGTGKTTALKAIVDIASQHRPVHVLALSGKAKERARESVGQDTYTIHSFLIKISTANSGLSTGGDPLVIIDESSMVDIALMLKLLNAFVKKELSLLLVGDTGQLSPIGYGIFFHALAKSKAIPSTHLTQVHRSIDDSDLQSTAIKIRSGRLDTLPLWNGEREGVYLIPCTTTQEMLVHLTKVKQLIPDAQILTPHMSERMADSGHKINKHLQGTLQHTDETLGIWMGKYWLRVNDPVIVSQNSYEHNLFNGNTGIMIGVSSIDEQTCGVFLFSGVEVSLSRMDLFGLGMKLAYAISIHKSQGSEYETSILCSLSQSEFVERSMLYTAVSRSKRLTLILSTQDIMRQGVARPNRSDTLCVGFSV